MITLEIDGVGKIKVDDSFAKLSKQQKQDFINHNIDKG